jgi:probable F420-dependent oxidoreductase
VTAPLLFGVRVLNFGSFASKNAIVEQAKIAEAEGYYSVWAAERILVPDPPNQPWSKISPLSFEEIAVLSHISGFTERVKLGTFVVIAPLRNPLILARQITTLDVLSNGRMILGLGLGWMKEEFDVSGAKLSERGARTDETIRFLREVWSSDRPSFDGRFIKMPLSFFEPKPVQRPIPIWIGGDSEAALKRAGRLGDGWLSNTLTESGSIERAVAMISEHARKSGRSTSSPSGGPVVISSKLMLSGRRLDVHSAVSSIEVLRSAGVNHIIADFDHESASEYQEKMVLFARDVIPSF